MDFHPTLLFSAIFALSSACIYCYTGWLLNKRIISSSEAQVAWRAFTIWWYGLAANTFLTGLLNLLGTFNLTNVAVFATVTYINLLVSCMALCGLVYYLVYLFTGSRRTLMPVIGFYSIYYILLVYYTAASIPDAVVINRWDATMAYRETLTGPFFIFMAILLILPQIAGGIAYFTLYFRVADVTQKYRVLLVSWSIIIWFVSPLIALGTGIAQTDLWQFATRFIGLAAALTMLMAYLPPQWLKQRYGIISLTDEKQER